MAEYLITNEPEAIPFEECGYIARRIAQNAKNLLMTRMGEVPYDRMRGFNPRLYDLPFQRFREELPEEIDRILLWEPRAELVSADAEILPDENGVYNRTVIRAVINVLIEE